MKLSSYQKLKSKCEYLQSQVDIFKNALTCYWCPKMKQKENKDGFIETQLQLRYKIIMHKLEEEKREKLQLWVAENLDKKTIMYLLKLKEKHHD